MDSREQLMVIWNLQNYLKYILKLMSVFWDTIISYMQSQLIHCGLMEMKKDYLEDGISEVVHFLNMQIMQDTLFIQSLGLDG